MWLFRGRQESRAMHIMWSKQIQSEHYESFFCLNVDRQRTNKQIKRRKRRPANILWNQFWLTCFDFLVKNRHILFSIHLFIFHVVVVSFAISFLCENNSKFKQTIQLSRSRSRGRGRGRCWSRSQIQCMHCSSQNLKRIPEPCHWLKKFAWPYDFPFSHFFPSLLRVDVRTWAKTTDKTCSFSFIQFSSSMCIHRCVCVHSIYISLFMSMLLLLLLL